ncbi:hydantoinase B/oxoprolinase family protein [Pantoea sp. DY-5]|nr:hydantoinase B/oxoprolinase family protein [Pantoea sp. DY-5]
MGYRVGVDIGGTSADVAVTSVGQGGGSLAWIDNQGVLQMGPDSAGSLPGPVCFQRGSTQPTATDAFAACGMIGHGDLGYNAVQVDVAADAMAFTLMRTAHSTFVKETEDFSCQIVSRDGLAFASPRSFGAPWYSGIDYGPVLGLTDSYEEGDICITNDSYAGNVATHSPDIHIWKPVFHGGEIVCFVVGHIHNTDVGGAVPTSLSRSLTDIVQEGIRIPPLKIVRNGELNEEVARIMRLNVRAPEQNWGDFKAQIASVNVGERKIHDIIARFGVTDFLQGIEGILDYAEAQARSIIKTIPDGEYFYADFADEDGEGGFPCRVAITLRVSGDTLELDYTGSDPQRASSLNMPTGGRERHPLALVGVTYVLSTLDRNLQLNAGTLRPTRAILPPGTVMNCEAPAAVGMRSLTCALSQIATLGVFSQAIPNRLPANSPAATRS